MEKLDLGLLFDDDVSAQHKDLKVNHSEIIDSRDLSLSRVETDVSHNVCNDVVNLNYVNLWTKEKPDRVVSVLNDPGTDEFSTDSNFRIRRMWKRKYPWFSR